MEGRTAGGVDEEVRDVLELGVGGVDREEVDVHGRDVCAARGLAGFPGKFAASERDVLLQPAFWHISLRTLYLPASLSTATILPSSPAMAAAIVVLFPGAAVESITLTPFFFLRSLFTSFSSLVSTTVD